jgi:sugar/nucleoside kinase (ribokinase family)
MQIVVVGSVALDTIETPWASAEDCLGGSALYFAVAASYFAPVQLVAVVGNDLSPRATDLLRDRGVDLQGLEVVDGATFRWGGRYREDMNRRDTLFTHLNVFEHFHPKLPEGYRDADIVFLANIHPALQLEVLGQVHGPQIVAMDTMNLWIETARKDLEAVLARVDVLFLNDEEIGQLTGERLLLPAVEAVRGMGPSTVVVKRGEHGAVLFSEYGRFFVPAVLLSRVFDPTGAGDTFAGGFLGYLAQEGTFDDPHLRRAMVHGTVLASFVTEEFSVDRLLGLTPQDITGRLEELRDLAQWPEA